MLLSCFFHRQNKNRFEPLGPVFCLLSPCMTKNHVIVSILKIKAQRRSTHCIQNSSFQVIIIHGGCRSLCLFVFLFLCVFLSQQVHVFGGHLFGMIQKVIWIFFVKPLRKTHQIMTSTTATVWCDCHLTTYVKYLQVVLASFIEK